MSGNHYSKQVLQLEEILSKRIAQLVVLESENARLKQKEQALQGCIQGIEGSLAATRAVLELEAQLDSVLGIHEPSRSGDAGSGDTASGDLLGAIGFDQTTSTSSAAAAQAVLQALEVREQQAQAALSLMGCCDSGYHEPYSTRLLRRATADPAHALAIVKLPRSERLQYLVQAVQKMALLLPKYDSTAPSTSLGSAREQLHAVVDELSERVIVAGLLDPPAKKLGNMLINLETLEFEPYPPGYWANVVRNMQLTADQKAAMKLSWARVKANKAALTEQHSRLSERLEQLQLEQQQVQLRFEEQAAHLQDLQQPHSERQRRRTKEALSQQQQERQSQQQQQQQLQQQGTRYGSACQQLQQQAPPACTPDASGAAAWRHPWLPPEVQQQQHSQCQLPTGKLAGDTPLSPQQQQQQQQWVYIPVVTGVHQQAFHGGPQQWQAGQPGAALHQQPHAVLSDCADSSQKCFGSVLEQRPSIDVQQQQQPHQLPPSGLGATAAAAAAATGMPSYSQLPGTSSSRSVTSSPAVSGDVTDMADTSRGSFNSAMSEDLLLPMSSKEQGDIEQQLSVIIEKLKMQHFCQFLQFYNVLTCKQLARTYVDAWPFVPDAFAVCEALDELNWQ